MTVTIQRPLYNAGGYRLLNGDGAPLSVPATVESLEQATYDLLAEVRAVMGGPRSTLADEIDTVRNIATTTQLVTTGTYVAIALATIAFPELVIPAALLATLELADAAAGLTLLTLPSRQNTGGQVGGIYNGTQTVVPVTPPPSGYGGGDLEDIATAVWSHYVNNAEMGGTRTDQAADVVLAGIKAALELHSGQAGYLDSRNPDFSLVARDALRARMLVRGMWAQADATRPSKVDWSLWDGSETLVHFLDDHSGQSPWSYTGPDGVVTGHAWLHVSSGDTEHYWRCNVQEYQLPQASGRAFQPLALPPVWPGEGNVTYSEGIVLATGMNVEVPCDGCDLNILSTVKGIPYVSNGEYKLYKALGRIAFYSDTGYVEPWQGIPASQCHMMPKQLAHAGGFLLSFYTGLTGLVTPWTINA